VVSKDKRWPEGTPPGHTKGDTSLFGIEHSVSFLAGLAENRHEHVLVHCGRGPAAFTTPDSITQEARTETRVVVEVNNMILKNAEEC
jgi:hypothetical protein